MITILAYTYLAVSSTAALLEPHAALRSTREAYVINTNELCLDDCVDGMCVTNLSYHKAECRLGTAFTKRYRTINNRECVSNCVPFSANRHDHFCLVDDGTVENCNRKLGLSARPVSLTLNVFESCTDGCRRLNEMGPHWCHVAGGSYQRCVPSRRELLIDHRTELGNLCHSPCKLDVDSVAKCYDETGAWRRCTLNPRFNMELQRVHDYVIGSLGEFDDKGYRVCAVDNKRVRRQTTDDYYGEGLIADELFAGDYLLAPDGNSTEFAYDPKYWVSDGHGNYYMRETPLVDVDPKNRTRRDLAADYRRERLKEIAEHEYYQNNKNPTTELEITLDQIEAENDHLVNHKHRIVKRNVRGGFNVEKIARYYERNNPSVVTNSMPVIGYTFMPVDAKFGEVKEHVPLVMRGLINKLTFEFDLHKLPFCRVTHNTTNAGRYYELSSQLGLFLNYSMRRYAEVLAVHIYDENVTQKAMGLRIRLYDGDQLVSFDGTVLSGASMNVLENMLFSTISNKPVC